MAKQSKFYSVTNQVLLEYITDQYRITSTLANIPEEGEELSQIYMYLANDGKQYCLDMRNYLDTKYPNENNNSIYYYGGNDLDDIDLDGVPNLETSDAYGRDLYINEDNKVGTIIKSANMGTDENPSYDECRTPSILIRDTIRLYLSTGYVMNNIAGYSIKVKARVNRVTGENPEGEVIAKRLDDYIYLLDWFMPKENLKYKINWLPNPLYLNSKFYDRYIEIKFPSPLDAAINDRQIDYVYEYRESDQDDPIYLRGKIDRNSVVIVEFATVQVESIDYVNESNSLYESTFVLDPAKQISLSSQSNANNFNVRIFEDDDQKAIIYYPVYGDLMHAQDFNYSTMLKIETGTISMYDEADYDSMNDGIDDFIEMYGEGVFRWVIINELSVTYRYSKNILDDTEDQSNNVYDFTEYYTSTIDYSDKSNTANTDFYKSRFVPYIKPKNNMTCDSIIISYTAHLYNRMNNIDIIRTGSMAIDARKYSTTQINTANIVQYKIVNRLENVDKILTNTSNIEAPGKMVRSYYNTTSILIKDPNTGTMYSNGKMTLYLTHTNNNYMFKLYTVNDDNIRVPFDISGNIEYKLVFPNINGGKIVIFPNKDSENYNLTIGSLIFYITGDKASAIMNVPMSERYFAITTHIPNNSQEESTLYEGYVEWYI